MEEFTVNIDSMINDVDTPSYVKDLYRQIKKHGYMSIGEYFRQLATADLDSLLDFSNVLMPVKQEPGALTKQFEYSEEDKMRATDVLGRLAIGLILAEGGECNEESFTVGIQAACTFIALESLNRKNLIDVIRSNWSISYGNLEIAKLK